MTVDPTDERVIYVGIEPIHLYRTEDGGKNWEELTGVQDSTIASESKMDLSAAAAPGARAPHFRPSR